MDVSAGMHSFGQMAGEVQDWSEEWILDSKHGGWRGRREREVWLRNAKGECRMSSSGNDLRDWTATIKNHSSIDEPELSSRGSWSSSRHAQGGRMRVFLKPSDPFSHNETLPISNLIQYLAIFRSSLKPDLISRTILLWSPSSLPTKCLWEKFHVVSRRHPFNVPAPVVLLKLSESLLGLPQIDGSSHLPRMYRLLNWCGYVKM